jgi:hypothetical protein
MTATRDVPETEFSRTLPDTKRRERQSRGGGKHPDDAALEAAEHGVEPE